MMALEIPPKRKIAEKKSKARSNKKSLKQRQRSFPQSQKNQSPPLKVGWLRTAVKSVEAVTGFEPALRD